MNLSTALIEHHPHDELTLSQVDGINALVQRVFFLEGTKTYTGPLEADGVTLAVPRQRIVKPNGTVYDLPPQVAITPRPNRRHFVLWDKSAARGHAEFFDRTVLTEQGPRHVAALAAVCVERDRHGAGLGRRIMEATFAAVDDGPYCGALFQTGVPGFYEKLGCREVRNRFVNRTTALDPEANPWWDRHTMIYPARLDWPDGVIDLNGGGY